MLENLKVSTATDIYGLGLILWEMKSGERPFVNLTLEEVCSAIKEGHKPTMPSDVTDDLRALMTACWCTDPRQRPNCEEVLSKLNQMSFPNNHWQALFGNSPLIDTPIGNFWIGHFPFGHFTFRYFPFRHFPFGHFPYGHFSFKQFLFRHFLFGHFPIGHFSFGHFSLDIFLLDIFP